jgi:hypothetical protein
VATFPKRPSFGKDEKGIWKQGREGLRKSALRSLRTGRGKNCPKTPLISYYQGKMVCESMVIKALRASITMGWSCVLA